MCRHNSQRTVAISNQATSTMPEEKRSWLDREIDTMIEVLKQLDLVADEKSVRGVLEQRFKESYKNGAMAERRKQARSAETSA